jgi:hypothetical protein
VDPTAEVTESARATSSGCEGDLKATRRRRPAPLTCDRECSVRTTRFAAGEPARVCAELANQGRSGNLERNRATRRTPRVARPMRSGRPLQPRSNSLQADQMNFDTLAVPLELLGSIGCQS